MKQFLIITFIGILLSACSKEKEAGSEMVRGTLKDYTGLDGCAWVIEIPGNKGNINRLEPMNLDDFNIAKKDGLKIIIGYQITDRGSICMVGPVIRLIYIQKA